MTYHSSSRLQATTKYFDRVAGAWFRGAYEPGRNLPTFPAGKIRQEITVGEMKRLRVNGRVLDLGCGTGQLVIELLRRNYQAVGVDNSSKMIQEARKFLKRALPNADPLRTFRQANVLNFVTDQEVDSVTAMGLLEYLPDDHVFFRTIEKILRQGGWAFVECRNRLFNLTSANQYTCEAARSGDLRNLVQQLDTIGEYSPTPLTSVPAIQRRVSAKIATLLEQKSRTKRPTRTAGFPGFRKQHTPEELERVTNRAGLNLRHVVYYHFHPYLPRYEREFPDAFNRIALAMQPLGYTALGSTLCSAFVAAIQK